MYKFLDNTVNFGFGLFSYSREKLEEFVEKMVDTGKVEKEDAQSFMKELVEKGDEERKEIKDMVKKEVADAVQDVQDIKGEGLSKEDIRAIVREELDATKNTKKEDK